MKVFPILMLTATLILVACKPMGSGGAGSTDLKPSGPPIATVNGEPISRAFYEYYVKAVAQKPSSELPPEARAQLLDNLIRAKLIGDQAAKDGVTKDPDTSALLELSRLNVLQQAVSQRYLKDKKPTEQELRAEYETQIGTLAKTEYHAQHILVSTEAAANQIIDKLRKGADFGDLAKKESLDSSKGNGGDLGWFTPDRMVKPFADAVVTLKKGEYTPQPIQTQYGFHVIKLLDTRDMTPPPYDAVKDRLAQLVQAKKFRAYEDGLIATAKIEKTPDTASPAPKAATPAPTTPAP